MIDKIREWYCEEDLLLVDGFDQAIIGVEDGSMRLIYSISKMMKVLMKDMDEDEAWEYLEYNVLTAYVGEKTPIYCRDDL
jgi:hypothetical protein